MMAFVSQWMTQVTSRVAVGHGGWCARRAGMRCASRLKGLDEQVREEPTVTPLQDIGTSEILKGSEKRAGAPKGGKALQPPRQKKTLGGLAKEELKSLSTQLENMSMSEIPKETKAGAPKGGKATQRPRQKKRLDGLVQEEPKVTPVQDMGMSEILKETRAGAPKGGKAPQPPRQKKRPDGLVEALVQEEPTLTQLQNMSLTKVLKAAKARAPKSDRAPQAPRQGKRLKAPLRMSAESQTEPRGRSEEVPLTLGKPEAELEELWKSGKYGTCQSCGGPVTIPGLSHQYCPSCGWVMRPMEDWVINTKEDARSQHVELEETDFK